MTVNAPDEGERVVAYRQTKDVGGDCESAMMIRRGGARGGERGVGGRYQGS